MAKAFEKIRIIVHENENNDNPLFFHSSIGVKCTVNGQEEGIFLSSDKPTFTVAEVVNAVNHLLYEIIEGGDT